MEVDPTSFEEAMRSAHSSKWLTNNGVWDLQTIPKGTNIVGCKWSTKLNMTSKRM